jgi:hypothetical protein
LLPLFALELEQLTNPKAKADTTTAKSVRCEADDELMPPLPRAPGRGNLGPRGASLADALRVIHSRRRQACGVPSPARRSWGRRDPSPDLALLEYARRPSCAYGWVWFGAARQSPPEPACLRAARLSASKTAWATRRALAGFPTVRTSAPSASPPAVVTSPRLVRPTRHAPRTSRVSGTARVILLADRGA